MTNSAMGMQKNIWLWALVLLTPWAAMAADEPAARTAYAVARMGDAKAPELVQPGHESAFALRLPGVIQTWARWNLPMFEAQANTEGVALWARRVGPSPRKLTIRILEVDGSEWSSSPLELKEEWNEYRLKPADFRYFRSRDERKDTPIRMSHACQIQFVPGESIKDAKSIIEVDNVRILPDGPGWTFEAEEQAPAISNAQGRADQFIFIAATHAESLRLAERREAHLRQSIEAIRALAAEIKPGDTFENLLARYGEKARARAFAFQAPAPEFEPPAPIDAAARDTALARLNERAKTFAAASRPIARLADADLPRWTSSRLYSAPEQPEPVWTDNGRGGHAILLPVRFTAAEKQVAFLNMPLDKTLDIDRRFDTLWVRARISSTAIHPKEGVRIRLYSEGNDAWTDTELILPEDLKPDQWSEYRVQFDRFTTKGHFDPKRFKSLSFRIENAPGAPAAFDFAVSDIELRLENPDLLAMQALRGEQENELAERNEKLLRLYDERFNLTRQMSPALRRFYLWSHLNHPAPGAPAPLATAPAVLANASAEKPRGLLTARVQGAVPETGRAADGQIEATLILRGASEKPSHYEIALFDHAGRCIHAARAAVAPAGETTYSARIEGVYYYWPGCPYLYNFRVAAMNGERVLDTTERAVGFCTVAYRESEVTGSMRHARTAARRDWSAWINGQPWFPQGTRAGLQGTENPADSIALFRDLWMEFQRNYGFAARYAVSDAFLKAGIMETCSVAPSYSSIKSYTDAEMLAAGYPAHLRPGIPDMLRANVLHYAVGNEVELSIWGAGLDKVYGQDIWIPLERAARAVRAELGRNRPVSYVRASSFSAVPDLPSDDMAGVNEYTGRYGGRMGEAPRSLAILSANTALRGWPLYISEWNGPKYSWASRGISGCTERGSAYYIQKYWDAMLRTPGVTASSEFVLNWVATAIEDLTSYSIEEGMARRPKYNPFGGGSTAGHIPHMWPGRIDPSVATYQYMLGFHGPLYLPMELPGDLRILHTPENAPDAREIADILRPLGKTIATETLSDTANLATLDASLLVLGAAGVVQPPLVRDLQERRIIGAILDGFPEPATPLIQKRVHPDYPDRALVVVTASDAAGLAGAIEHLKTSARALVRIRREAGAVRRLLALVDSEGRRDYEDYFNEFATRGFFHDFDDTCTRLEAAQLFGADGQLLPRYADLAGVVVDTKRAVEPNEVAALLRLSALGVNIVVSRTAYAASPELKRTLGVAMETNATLAESLPVETAWRKPLAVPEMGNARPDRIQQFAAKKVSDIEAALLVSELAASGWEPVVKRAATSRPVVVSGRPQNSKGRWFVFGCPLREVFFALRRTTQSGAEHALYDRNTACGLERVARVAVNCLWADLPAERDAHALIADITPASSFVSPTRTTAVRLTLRDETGAPVEGATLLAAAHVARNIAAKRADPEAPFAPLAAAAPAPGIYEFSVGMEGSTTPANGGATVLSPAPGEIKPGQTGIVLEIKAMKPGCLVWEGALTLVAETAK